jgi:RND family efflux transporter MFP subunit
MQRERIPFVWVLCLCACALAAPAAEPAGIEAISRPSKDVVLSFVRPGRVARVLVKEGDKVQEDQLLIELDDGAERVQLEQLVAEAKDDTRVKAAEAQLEQKQVELKRLQEAERPPLEIDRARLEVTISALRLRLARLEHEQTDRKVREARIQLERMRRLSPFAGTVEEVRVRAGESVDKLQPVIRLVKTDPLWVDVPVPLDQARRIQVGRSARVTFPQQSAPAGLGEVIHVAAVADAASNTVTVRVEVPNPAGRPAGEHVHVEFPAEPAIKNQGER